MPDDCFMLRSAEDGVRLEFYGGRGPLQLDDDGWTSFFVSLTAPGLQASVRVIDHFPSHWSALFRDLAANWSGWQGNKVGDSLEGHLGLSCTNDGLGHIEVLVDLHDTSHGWRAKGRLILEAGQLEAIARAAERFFG